MKKGFTLIELLVVVAIIGILALVVTGSISGARANARDAQRETDIKAIQSALEVYYIDNGAYPTTSWAHSNASSWATLETALGVSLPVDPVNEGSSAASGDYVYSYLAHSHSSFCTGQAYMLVFNKEKSNGTSSNDGVTFCSGTYTYGDAFVVGMSPYE